LQSKSCASCSPFWLEQAKEGLLNRLTGSLGIDLARHDLITIPEFELFVHSHNPGIQSFFHFVMFASLQPRFKECGPRFQLTDVIEMEFFDTNKS